MKIYIPLHESEPVNVETFSSNEKIYPKGICSSGFMRMWKKNKTGKGITISVLDTGIDGTHPDLVGKITETKNFTTFPNPEDHGTHVAGIIAAKGKIYGGAPDSNLLDCKILSSKGGNLKTLLAGIKWSVEKKANIINMSIGSTTLSKLEINLLKSSITHAWNNGSLCIAASGNDGTKTGKPDPYAYPASLESVISVGSCSVGSNLNDIKLSKFSNENDSVDICACGSEILSCVTNSKYAMYNGTSMAAPHVSAFAAILAEDLLAKGYKGSEFCKELTNLIKQNVYHRSDMKKISYGSGFIRFPPFDKPSIPSDLKFTYNSILLGYLISKGQVNTKNVNENILGEILMKKNKKDTRGIAKTINVNGVFDIYQNDKYTKNMKKILNR